MIRLLLALRRVRIWLRNPTDPEARDRALRAIEKEVTVNGWSPALVAEYLFKLHFVRRHRRVLGAVFTILGVLALGAAHPSVGAQLPALSTYGTYLTAAGVYLLAVGTLFKNDPAKLGPAPKA